MVGDASLSPAYTDVTSFKGAAAVAAGNRMVGPPSSWSRDQEDRLLGSPVSCPHVGCCRPRHCDPTSHGSHLASYQPRSLSANRVVAGVPRLRQLAAGRSLRHAAALRPPGPRTED